METKQIKAIGNFLSTYQSDLTYIANFHLYKNGELETNEFIRKNSASFYDFLIEFNVTRNFEQGKAGELLKLTSEWINGVMSNDVDGFAFFLKSKSLTKGKTLTSLASKILFLNDPWNIQPMDLRARTALGQKTKVYLDYLKLLDQYKGRNRNEINNCLKEVDHFAIVIESGFCNLINDISIIRCNRLIDKLLWTNGSSKDKLS